MYFMQKSYAPEAIPIAPHAIDILLYINILPGPS